MTTTITTTTRGNDAATTPISKRASRFFDCYLTALVDIDVCTVGIDNAKCKAEREAFAESRIRAIMKREALAQFAPETAEEIDDAINLAGDLYDLTKNNEAWLKVWRALIAFG